MYLDEFVFFNYFYRNSPALIHCLQTLVCQQGYNEHNYGHDALEYIVNIIGIIGDYRDYSGVCNYVRSYISNQL